MVYVQLVPHKALWSARNCYCRGIVCAAIATDSWSEWKKLVNYFFQNLLTVLEAAWQYKVFHMEDILV